MTRTDADALLDAFLAAKAAGQEELWRASHPEAPDGPTVLIVWVTAMDRNVLDCPRFRIALEAVDNRCALRMAIYAAIIAHPAWENFCGKEDVQFARVPLAAIRAAIACYQDPTEENLRAAEAATDAIDVVRHNANLAWFASTADADAAAAYAVNAALYASETANAACEATAITWAAHNAAHDAYHAARSAGNALGNSEIVIDAMFAAIADHYEGRLLEMP